MRSRLGTCMAGAAHQADVLGVGLEQVPQAVLDLVHDLEEGRVHVAQQRQALCCAHARQTVLSCLTLNKQLFTTFSHNVCVIKPLLYTLSV